MQKFIFITTTFVGFHRWKDAPAQFGYLSHFHRHVFHVKLAVPVTDSNREIEFIDLKQQVTKECELNSLATYDPEWEVVADAMLPAVLGWSCEQWCEWLLEMFPVAQYAEVSEDGENGAHVDSNNFDSREFAKGLQTETRRTMQEYREQSRAALAESGEPPLPD